MRATRSETTSVDHQQEARMLSFESNALLQAENLSSSVSVKEPEQKAEKGGSVAEVPWTVKRFPFHSIRLAMRVTLIVTAMF